MRIEYAPGDIEKIGKWSGEHNVVCPQTKVGAIGGKFTYQITHTNLGTVQKVTCACGAELDLTDYESW